MKIKELHLQNFRGFEDVTIQFPESNVCVLIGANGSGKSSVLEIITNFFSIFNSNALHIDNEKYLENENDNLKKAITELVTNHQIDLRKESIRYDRNEAKHRIEIDFDNKVSSYSTVQTPKSMSYHYDAEYGFLLEKQRKNIPSYYPLFSRYSVERFFYGNLQIENLKKEISQIPQFSNKTINFDAFIKWFKDLEDKENAEKIALKDFNINNPLLNSIRDTIKIFLSEFHENVFDNLKVFREKTTIETEVNGKGEITLTIDKNGVPLKLQQLSDGEKLILMTVCDIARKLILLNPALENPLHGEGIILIDEIELHLHPQWQRNVIPALRKTFPNIQFIITTHSPQVLSNIKNEEVILLENGKAYQKFAQNFGQDSNTILTDFFNTSERPEEIKSELERLFQLIELEKNEEAESLLESLIKKLGENDSDLIKAKTELEYFADEIH